MIHVERCFLADLGEAAILSALRGSLYDEPVEFRWNRAFAHCESVSAILRARDLSNERSSARWTKPSASPRSSGVSSSP